MPETWIRQALTAEFLSDAHLGSGSGGSGVDSLVARDRHGRPVIWSSHIEGVLRDAARRLRGDQEAGRFFGRGGGEQQRAIFTSLYATNSLESRIWRSTARESFDNRAPKDDTLRVIEYVPKGTTLVGEVALPAGQLDALKRLVFEVDALGGGRSGGAGRVRLSLSDAAVASRSVGTPTGRLVLLLRNRDPLCITATAVPGNLIPSLAFVPGRTLLGALAAWLIADGHRETASLLTSGRISVSDALPLPHAPASLDGVEVLPAPLSLKSEKPTGATGDLPWWAQSVAPTRRVDGLGTEARLKRPEDDLFVYRENARSDWTSYRPARRVRLRSGRPDPKQADGLLFATEQLVEETNLLAEVHGSVDDLRTLSEKLGAVLKGQRWLRVGRGGAPVEVAQLAWTAASAGTTTGTKVLLTLTSDLLTRDDHLRWRTALDEIAVRDLLDADVQLGRSIQESVMIHGFNGTSGLWRMPAAAVRRGSVFELSGDGVAALAERFAKCLWLGERTHEGFGRFRIDMSLPGVTSEPRESNAVDPGADVSDETAAARTRTWFDEHRSLAKLGSGNDRKPSLSQWFDLVGELEAGSSSALTSRLSPTTAGGRSWKHRDAESVLRKLQAIQQQQRALHARLFVRWLRAEMRATAKGAR